MHENKSQFLIALEHSMHESANDTNALYQVLNTATFKDLTRPGVFNVVEVICRNSCSDALTIIEDLAKINSPYSRIINSAYYSAIVIYSAKYCFREGWDYVQTKCENYIADKINISIAYENIALAGDHRQLKFLTSRVDESLLMESDLMLAFAEKAIESGNFNILHEPINQGYLISNKTALMLERKMERKLKVFDQDKYNTLVDAFLNMPESLSDFHGCVLNVCKFDCNKTKANPLHYISKVPRYLHAQWLDYMFT